VIDKARRPEKQTLEDAGTWGNGERLVDNLMGGEYRNI
jgi:hypothetical protein